jgi:aldehyde:ferredoxin oxidoreductase
MACGRLSTVKEGRHKGLQVEGPEYETIYAFGGLCEIDSIEEIIYLNDICDRLGMDTISAGNLAALTIEAARQGRIDHAIDYGDVDAIADCWKTSPPARHRRLAGPGHPCNRRPGEWPTRPFT